MQGGRQERDGGGHEARQIIDQILLEERQDAEERADERLAENFVSVRGPHEIPPVRRGVERLPKETERDGEREENSNRFISIQRSERVDNIRPKLDHAFRRQLCLTGAAAQSPAERDK